MNKIDISMGPQDLPHFLAFLQENKDNATDDQAKAIGAFALAALLASLDGAITALKARNAPPPAPEIKPAVLVEVKDEFRWGPQGRYEYVNKGVDPGGPTIYEYRIVGQEREDDEMIYEHEIADNSIALGDMVLARKI